MKFIPLPIPSAFRIELVSHQDQRGFFVRTYDEAFFKARGLVTHWVQESHSYSRSRGTLRGLHFQRSPHAETKLIQAAQGKIFIVMVDLRKGSAAFGKPFTSILYHDKPELFYIPQGLALGMYTLTDQCSLLYKMDQQYFPASQGIIRWDDPDLNIPWPLAGKLIVSERDASAPLFKEFVKAETGFVMTKDRGTDL